MRPGQGRQPGQEEKLPKAADGQLGPATLGPSISENKEESIVALFPLYHRSTIQARFQTVEAKTMHGAASLRKKVKTLSLPLHAHSKHMGRGKVLLGQGIF